MSVVAQEGVEALDPASPDVLVAGQELLGALHSFGVAADPAFAAMRMFCHQSGSFQDCHMLLHGGERHVVERGQLGNRDLAVEGSTKDVTAGCIGKGAKDPIHLVVGESLVRITYNHLVVS